jgi:hypothetical protein
MVSHAAAVASDLEKTWAPWGCRGVSTDLKPRGRDQHGPGHSLAEKELTEHDGNRRCNASERAGSN